MADDRKLVVDCWCTRTEVAVPVAWIGLGRTGTCGHPQCQEGCEPAPDTDEIEIKEGRRKMNTFSIATYNPATDSSPGQNSTDALVLVAEAGQCLCGCGNPTTSKKARFIPGHDQRLKGILIRAQAAQVPAVARFEGKTTDYATAADLAAMFSTDSLDWSKMVATRAGALIAKADAKTRRATSGAKVRAIKAEPVVVTVKIGRWEYQAVQNEDGTLSVTGKDGSVRPAVREGDKVKWAS